MIPSRTLPRAERLRTLGAIRRLFESGESGFVYPFRYVWFAEADDRMSAEVLFSVIRQQTLLLYFSKGCHAFLRNRLFVVTRQ